MDRLASMLDMYNNHLLSEEDLSAELEADLFRLERNQMVKQVKIYNRIVSKELSSSNISYVESPEEILIEKEKGNDVTLCLLFIRYILGKKPFEIFFENVVCKVPQKVLAERYHYSRGGIASLIYYSRLKIQNALEKYPSKKKMFSECYESLNYHYPSTYASSSSKVGFLFEAFKAVCIYTGWHYSKKSKRKIFSSKTMCMIPEYLEGACGHRKFVCPLCVKCSRKDFFEEV